MLQQAILEREEQGETLSRLLPGGLAEKLRADPQGGRRTERLNVTVLMSDVRGYSGIAERTDPTVLAGQLDEHRREMNAAILAEGGTVMQYVGDAVMAVFGAPFPQDDHALRAVRAAVRMHRRQDEVNRGWGERGLPAFGLGIGVSTGEVAAALLGSDERLEYTRGRRHREPGPAPPGPGATGGDDRVERGHQAGGGRRRRRRYTRRSARQGPGKPVTVHRLVAVADLVGESSGPAT